MRFRGGRALNVTKLELRTLRALNEEQPQGHRLAPLVSVQEPLAQTGGSNSESDAASQLSAAADDSFLQSTAYLGRFGYHLRRNLSRFGYPVITRTTSIPKVQVQGLVLMR